MSTPKKTWQRYRIKPHEITGRPRVSGKESTEIYRIRVGRAIFIALRNAGPGYVRKELISAATKFLRIPANSGHERVMEELEKTTTLKIRT